MSYSIESLDAVAKGRYMDKLKLINFDVCPYQLPADVWVDRPTLWPDLEWPEVYDYLINSPGIFTRESMKSRKSLEAHNQFVCGWVRTVFCYTAKTNVILKADVMPSQRLNESPHIPWVAINKEATNIIAAHCTCMAGLGESCSHIGALLFKVEAAVRCGYTKLTCTEEACKWNNDFVKKITPVPIANVDFYSDEAVKNFKANPKKAVHQTKPTQQQQQQFFEAISTIQGENAIVLHTKSGFYAPFIPKVMPPERAKLPQRLRTLYKKEYASDRTKYKEALENMPELKITENDNVYLNSVTIKQHLSPVWHEMRSGRITASKVNRVLTTNLQSPAPSLIKDICKASAPRTTSIPSLKWGIDNEKVALEEYKLFVSNDHLDFGIEECGLKLCTSKAFLGASPDGLLTCKCHNLRQLIEIKCPYTLRDSLNSDCVLFLDGNKKLRTDHAYFAQVQFQLHVFELDICNFVVWTPNWMHITDVKYDEQFVTNSIPILENFHKNFVIPEILTRQLELSQLDVKPKTYKCICGGEYNSKGKKTWIGCDSNACHNEWYHLSCVNLKRIPKGKWYCPSCTKQKKTSLKGKLDSDKL